MKFKFRNICFSFSFTALAFFTLALLCDSDGKVLLCLAASIIHEAGHLLAMKLFGVRIKSFCVNLGDVAIVTHPCPQSFRRDFVVSASGVAANIVCLSCSLIFARIVCTAFFTDFAIANGCIAVFNILPVRFLDGGQLIMMTLERRFSYKVADVAVNILSVLVLVPLGVVGFVFLFASKYNYSLLFASLYLICTLISKELK